jgi:uncharacterized protein (DUF1684 family)
MPPWEDEVMAARSERDRFFAEHYASPLPDTMAEGFSGLAYFPPDPSWRLSGTYTPTDPRRVEVPSSSGTASEYTRMGSATLPMGGRAWTVTVLDDGDGNPFIPFRDGTSGTETYAGGRYVDLVIEDGGVAVVDFNAARNPWCAYDEEFVCPLPPPGNTTTVRIIAGERTPDGPGAPG